MIKFAGIFFCDISGTHIYYSTQQKSTIFRLLVFVFHSARVVIGEEMKFFTDKKKKEGEEEKRERD